MIARGTAKRIPRRTAERILDAFVAERYGGEEKEICLMPDGPTGWTASVMTVIDTDSGAVDSETDQTIYLHADGSIEGPY